MIMIVWADSTDTSFKALQQLVLDQGWKFSVRPDEPKPETRHVPLPRGANVRRYRKTGITIDDFVFDYMKTRGGHITTEDATKYCLKEGYAASSAGSALSRLKNAGRITMNGNGEYLVR